MIDPEHLKYIITEDLYLVQEKTNEPVNEQDDESVDEKYEPTETIHEHSSSDQNYGENTQKAWLLVATKTLTEEEEELLSKILKAVNVTESDYELEVGSTQKIPLFKKAIIFSSQEVGEFYKVGNFKGTQLLSSRPLSYIKDSREEKMKLWNALKLWFQIV